jgi:hypothetical protein
VTISAAPQDSEEKHEPVSDIDTAAADSLKVLDLKRPIREADISSVWKVTERRPGCSEKEWLGVGTTGKAAENSIRQGRRPAS